MISIIIYYKRYLAGCGFMIRQLLIVFRVPGKAFYGGKEMFISKHVVRAIVEQLKTSTSVR